MVAVKRDPNQRFVDDYLGRAENDTGPLGSLYAGYQNVIRDHKFTQAQLNELNQGFILRRGQVGTGTFTTAGLEDFTKEPSGIFAKYQTEAARAAQQEARTNQFDLDLRAGEWRSQMKLGIRSADEDSARQNTNDERRLSLDTSIKVGAAERSGNERISNIGRDADNPNTINAMYQARMEMARRIKSIEDEGANGALDVAQKKYLQAKAQGDLKNRKTRRGSSANRK